MPESGPLTIAFAEGSADDGRVTGTAQRGALDPCSGARGAGRANRRQTSRHRGCPRRSVRFTDGHNLGGEPRDIVEFDLPADDFAELDAAVADELTRRGAWARCVQCIGALDAAAELSVAHTRERVQFGRPLSKFQAVQHTLAQMAGEIERARAATELAVAARDRLWLRQPRRPTTP